jgi:outer membrane immunogenic protein
MSLDCIKAGAAALLLLALPSLAHADDVRSKVAKKAYAWAAPPKHNWTGLYGGVNLGYGLAGISDNTPLAVSTIMHGVVGGVQIGYNYQTGSWVWGLEADIQASDQSTSYTQTFPIVGNVTAGQKIPYFGTVRGRLGYAFDCGCVMAYVTGGVAYGAYNPYATALGVTVSTTYTNAAATGGAGVEWMVSDHWSAKLEALYIDTGNVGTGVTVPVFGEIHARVRDAITRIGLNYHF